MNANELHEKVAKAVNIALASGQTPASVAIAVLENIKLEIFCAAREMAKAQTVGIIPIRGTLPKEGN